MARAGRRLVEFAVVAVVAAAGLAVPTAARAEPPAGSVTAVFSDICGFVVGEFTNSDSIAAQVRYSRNGMPLASYGGFVGGGMSATLYQVAAAGDVVRFEWDIEGGTTESLEHEHVTPAGCAEPDLSVALVDDCGLEFTVSITNTGSAPVDVVLFTPTRMVSPLTVPVGTVRVTGPGVEGSGASVARFRPGGTDLNEDLAEVATATRAPGCGLPWPAEPKAFFTPTCDRVDIVFFAVGMKGRFIIYRNGMVALDTTVGSDIREWTVPVARGDVITLEKPPLATYVHAPPAGCPAPPASASARGRAGAPAPPRIDTLPAAPPVRPAPGPPAPPIGTTSEPATPSSSAPPPPLPAAAGAGGGGGVNLAWWVLAAIVGTAALLALAGGWRRRRRPVWAVAYTRVAAAIGLKDVGRPPSLSVRWTLHADPGTQTLREGASP